jgi:hypothetical protein
VFPRPSDRALVFAAVAGATVIAVAACGGGGNGGGQTNPSADTQPTVTATATQTATATETATATSSATSTPTGGGGTPTCATAGLKIGYADDKGGGGAGSVMGTFTLTNTGSASCTLRGFPGVSFVGGGNGTQVGAPATRTGDAVTTRTLAAGKSATVALRRTQPGNYGSSCKETKVDGFRVYPPESTASAFVAFKTTGCKNVKDPLLQVGPVR